MSYVRWSLPGRPHPYDSALYVYEDGTGIVCCDCLFLDDADHREPTRSGMVDHVERHIAAGHAVPDFVVPNIKADIERRGDAA